MQRLVRRKHQVPRYFSLRHCVSRTGEGKSLLRARRQEIASSQPVLPFTPTPLPLERERGPPGEQRQNDPAGCVCPPRPGPGPAGRPAPPLTRAPRVPRAAAPPTTQVSRQETPRAPTVVHTGEGGRLSGSRGRTCRAGLAPRPLALTGRAAAAWPRPAQTAPPLPQLRAPATSGQTPPTRGHPSYAVGISGGASAIKVRADPESSPCSPHGPQVPSLPPPETRFAT